MDTQAKSKKRRQDPTVRLPVRLLKIVREQNQRIERERGVRKSLGKFVGAAVVPFLRLAPGAQLDAIYRLEEFLDQIVAAQKTEPDLQRAVDRVFAGIERATASDSQRRPGSGHRNR